MWECFVQKKSSEFWVHRYLAVLLRRIMGFRCYIGASDIRVYRQSPKAWYQLNTDRPHHGFRDYMGDRCAISDTKCGATYFNFPFSLHFFSSHLLLCFAVSFCQIAHKRKSQAPISAYWGKWTFEVTEVDVGLSAREDASELSEGPLGRQW